MPMKNLLKKIIVCSVLAAALVVLYAVKPADDRTGGGLVAVADEASTTPGANPTDGASPSGSATPSGGATQAGSTTPAAGQLPDGITRIQMLYTKEEIVVTSNAQVYYAPLKKPTDATVKPADIIQAAKVSDDTYMIDISCYSASKDVYLGITNKLSADSNGLYPVMNCKIPGTYKKVLFNPNYAAEGSTASGYGILKNVIVNNTDGTTVTYDNDSANTKTRPITELKIEWKKAITVRTAI